MELVGRNMSRRRRRSPGSQRQDLLRGFSQMDLEMEVGRRTQDLPRGFSGRKPEVENRRQGFPRELSLEVLGTMSLRTQRRKRWDYVTVAFEVTSTAFWVIVSDDHLGDDMAQVSPSRQMA